MLLNVMQTGGEYDLQYHEMTAEYWLAVPLESGESYGDDTRVVGTVEVEEVLNGGPDGKVETVKIEGRTCTFAGVNPIANKIVFEDEAGTQLIIGF